MNGKFDELYEAALAEENDIVLLKSELSLFKISGILFEAGVNPVF